MFCKVADLLVEIPDSGGLASRCQSYLWNNEKQADIVIRTELYDASKYDRNMSEEQVAYMESGRQFCARLLEYNGLYLHASAVEMDGKAFLFSAKSGTGKSTHTRLWQQIFGDAAQVFNDDKPALRRLEGKWFAYGTPWCGKDGINQNKKVPLVGICFLKQASENRIRRLSITEAIQKLIPQTIYRFQSADRLNLALTHISNLVQEIPIYELDNKPEPEAAWLSYKTMSREAREQQNETKK